MTVQYVVCNGITCSSAAHNISDTCIQSRTEHMW